MYRSHPHFTKNTSMYGCMYVCMHVWMDVGKRMWMCGCMYIWMYVGMYVCMLVCNVCLYPTGTILVQIHLSIHTHRSPSRRKGGREEGSEAWIYRIHVCICMCAYVVCIIVYVCLHNYVCMYICLHNYVCICMCASVEFLIEQARFFLTFAIRVMLVAPSPEIEKKNICHEFCVPPEALISGRMRFQIKHNA